MESVVPTGFLALRGRLEPNEVRVDWSAELGLYHSDTAVEMTRFPMKSATENFRFPVTGYDL